jgi:hypothetical protein
LATFACPWWPTGLGVFGILASSAQAVVIAAIALWPLRQEFSAHTGKRYRSVLLAATPCLVLYLSYYFYLNSVELLSDDSFSHKIKSVLPRLFWTNPVFLPVMWTTVAVTVYLSVRLALRQLRPQHTVPAIEFWVFLAPGVVMSSRGFFGTTLIPITALSAVCYPFLILAAPVLLWKLLSPLAPSASKPVWVVSAFVLGYVFIRLVGAYPIMLDGAGYRELATKAGAIRVRDNDGSAEIYEYVVRTTAPSDFVLCMPYCGGVNVAAQRRSPIYTVQFKQLRPSLLYQAKDVDGMKQRPPKVVIVDDAPHYGTVFGLPANMECPCPRLVWQPDQWSAKPEYVFPVVEYIQEHYRVDRNIGSRLVLIPK